MKPPRWLQLSTKHHPIPPRSGGQELRIQGLDFEPAAFAAGPEHYFALIELAAATGIAVLTSRLIAPDIWVIGDQGFLDCLGPLADPRARHWQIPGYVTVSGGNTPRQF